MEVQRCFVSPLTAKDPDTPAMAINITQRSQSSAAFCQERESLGFVSTTAKCRNSATVKDTDN
ncbi:hypothetical protein NQZ68_005793 [Dissostichus eleginoides]|nr:hypothetical protein NQZ68_005793 [Dissostichus eleginoides]